MAREKKSKDKKTANGGNLGFEEKLWQAADKMRGHMDPAEYKHVVLGLIFLKYISDAFEERHKYLEKQVAELSSEYFVKEPTARYEVIEERDEYTSENIFWVPKDARWSYLQANAKQPAIGKLIDDAMGIIEKENQKLKAVLPKDYARPTLDKHTLGELIDIIGSITLTSSPSPTGRGENEIRGEGRGSQDVLGRVYEYFLGRFASAEGKGGGEFYTPQSVVKILVEMIEPYKGRVYDPCCGSGGMFVQSEKFVEAHGGRRSDIAIWGQESNSTTWRLCNMNLAIRGIEGNIGSHHADTFRQDIHKDLKADFILANPPFNVSDWKGELLREDVRWRYGTPPVGNANFAWVQHFIHHLAPNGITGFVLANGSMSSNQSGEGEIRKNIIEADLVDCMIALPGQLFYTTPIPACLWFIARNKSGQPSPAALRHPLPEGEGHYRGGFDFAGLLKPAREMRKKQTPAEDVFWGMVRDRRFMNLIFRRQHQIGDYVVDFFCLEEKLIVELDGEVHNTTERQRIDKKRDSYLNSLGFKILRFSNDELFKYPENVLKKIASEIITPSPSGRGAGVRVNGFRDRRGETLFIDARKMGYLIDRTHREFSDEEIHKIAQTYHAWRSLSPLPMGEGQGEGIAYRDIPGFCKSATLEEIRSHGYVLTPGRYVGAEDIEDDGEPFNEKMKQLVSQLEEQFTESARLEAVIKRNLRELGVE